MICHKFIFNTKINFLLVCVFMCFVSCNSNPTNTNSTTTEHHLTISNNSQTVLMGIGDTIDLILQTIGPGSYETPVITGNTIKFIYDSTLSPANPGGPTQKYGFVGINTGNSSVSISHSNSNSIFAITCKVQ
jgi:hypothetical protein